jgi:hypothetical protein
MFVEFAPATPASHIPSSVDYSLNHTDANRRLRNKLLCCKPANRVESLAASLDVFRDCRR